MGKVNRGAFRGDNRWKNRLKGILRRTFEEKSGTGYIATNVFLYGLKVLGKMPIVGPFGNRWAGFIHAVRSEHNPAIEMYRKAIRGGWANNSGLRYDLGMSLMKTGYARDAEQEFRAVMQALPGKPWPINALILSLQDQGLAKQIVPELLKATKNVPLANVRDLPFPSYLAHLVAEDPAQVAELSDLVREHPSAFYATLLLAQVQTLRKEGSIAASLFRAAGKIRFQGVEDPSAKIARPKFLILGQAKAGTTALFQYLSEHPGMVPPLIKEPQFWSQNYPLGLEWYDSLFPRLPERCDRFTGEGSVNYLVNPFAPKRVFEAMPGVKLIVLLRDPVSRAYSDYWMHRRVGRTNETFEEAVMQEMERLPICPLDPPGETEKPLPIGHLVRSAALPFLKSWMQLFQREQLLVLKNEDMARDLPGTMRRVCRFLDVPNFVPLDPKRHNEGRYVPISDELRTKLSDWFAPHQAALDKYLAELFGTGIAK